MDIITIEAFFLNYSTVTSVIAILSTIITSIIGIIFKKKITPLLKIYLPLIIAFVCHLSYDMIFVSKSFTIKGEILYASFISGTFSIAISAFILRLSQNKPTTDMQYCLVDGIISEIVITDRKENVIKQILLIVESEIEYVNKTDEICKEILSNAIEELTENEAQLLANQILTSLKLM